MPVKTRLQSKNNSDQKSSINSNATSSENQQIQNIDPRYVDSSPRSLRLSQKKQLRHYHHNACRTKINLILDRKNIKKDPSEKQKKRRISYFLMAQQYKRKLSQGIQIPEQEYQTKRKISWNQQSQYIQFNKNKSCQAIKTAPRHKFSIDQ